MITKAKDLPNTAVNKQKREFEWFEKTYPEALKKLDFILNRAKKFPTKIAYKNFGNKAYTNFMYATDRGKSRRIFVAYMKENGYRASYRDLFHEVNFRPDLQVTISIID